METNIGIKDKHLEQVSAKLAIMLADEVILNFKNRNAHWNVEGKDFYAMHQFFEDQYDKIAEIIDDLAERMRALGHYSPATLKEFLQLTRLTEKKMEGNDSKTFIAALLADHESIIIHLREHISFFNDDCKDTGTADFCTSLLETHEKMAWMLRAHLK